MSFSYACSVQSSMSDMLRVFSLVCQKCWVCSVVYARNVTCVQSCMPVILLVFSHVCQICCVCSVVYDSNAVCV